MSRKRDETKQRTREALVNAALELFSEQGLDVPSLDAICDRAGFTRGAFYVHFADREELLVAVMDHVGEAFLASMFAGASPGPREEPRSGAQPQPRRDEGALRAVADRFVGAVKEGRYPLMSAGGQSPPGGARVRMHQLLDACARSPVVRERYRGLVEASIAAVASLAGEDQRAGVLRRDVDREEMGKLALATIIGAQTMGDLGVTIDPERLARTLLRLLDPAE